MTAYAVSPYPIALAKDLMTAEVLTVYEGWPIKRLADFFIRHGISGAPVIASDHTLVGVVTLSDIVRFSSLDEKAKASLAGESLYMEYVGPSVMPEDMEWLKQNAANNCTINSIMTREVISLEETASLPQIACLMSERKIRRLFITRDGVIVGVISTGNILQYLASFEA